MAMRIIRRPKAVADAEEIADYIAHDSLEASVRFLENAEATLHDLADGTKAGSLFESDNRRLRNIRLQRVAGFPNHFIFFVKHNDAVEVLRILHAARDLDSTL